MWHALFKTNHMQIAAIVYAPFEPQNSRSGPVPEVASTFHIAAGAHAPFEQPILESRHCSCLCQLHDTAKHRHSLCVAGSCVARLAWFEHQTNDC